MKRGIEDIDRLYAVRCNCFMTDYDTKWLNLLPHLENFIKFEEFIMSKYKLTRDLANIKIGDIILKNLGDIASGSLSNRLVKVSMAKELLSKFSIDEGFDISESFSYLYKFQEDERVLIMSVMFGMREELLYY